MKYLQFTDFRNHSKEYFNQIENGESFVIIRKGKPVAQMIPFQEPQAGWHTDSRKVTLKPQKNTLDLILSERNES